MEPHKKYTTHNPKPLSTSNPTLGDPLLHRIPPLYASPFTISLNKPGI